MRRNFHSTIDGRRVCARGIVIDSGRVAFDGPLKEAGRFYEDNFVRKDEIEKTLEEEIEERSVELETDDEEDNEEM